MSDLTLDMADFHWVMQIMDTMDSGLLVIDREYNVCVWNSFMQSYSGILSQHIMGKNLFEVCPDLPESWLKTKVEAAADLETKSFSSWEDRSYLFEFCNFSPVSNGEELMYQDVVITPLRSLCGDISHLSIIINDVSDIAKNKIQMREANLLLSKASKTDGLTGLYNRKFWEECLKEEFNRTLAVDSSSSIVIFDIDHFKKVNDTYGHTVGDDVIRKTAQIVQQTARGSDVCGRYGGEEFTVLLPDTTSDQAQYFAERLRKRIERTVVESDGHEIQFTVSLGVCETSLYVTDYMDWLKQADNCLYRSKENGRNQTTVFMPSDS
ncbi:sensor domain-containing diguanylate cyclase [Vibrio sp. T187]|uniref:sensor domain-containing diguanylate cyclase n=1 Tax=Vibrio TaxID=662 RepID=UPI0010C9D7F8|nr:MULTISPECIES: diguanylate cyclase [Vibrio]MBW3697821.1 sensor domain-containing diguanylate cyclase [Vibrio sp. T187]